MKKGLATFRTYLVESWQEVRPRDGKVTWPTWEDTKASALVVVVVSGILGVYLFAVDMVVSWILGAVLGTGA